MLQETQDEEMDNTVIEMNAWVDAVLKVVYDHGTGSGRNIIFSSFNPDICLMLSFKQVWYFGLFCEKNDLITEVAINSDSLPHREWDACIVRHSCQQSSRGNTVCQPMELIGNRFCR